jgi:hypothetical protein
MVRLPAVHLSRARSRLVPVPPSWPGRMVRGAWALLAALLVLFRLSPAAAQAAQGTQAAQAPATGVIAYVRQGKEIRLIAPDGTGDRRLWAHPRPELARQQGVTSLAWHPDGKLLAFCSGHEAVYSLYAADLDALQSRSRRSRRFAAVAAPTPPACAIPLTSRRSRTVYSFAKPDRSRPVLWLSYPWKP